MQTLIGIVLQLHQEHYHTLYSPHQSCGKTWGIYMYCNIQKYYTYYSMHVQRKKSHILHSELHLIMLSQLMLLQGMTDNYTIHL